MGRSFETLRLKPDDAGSLVSWRAGAIISATLAESVGLFGVAIHFLGGSNQQVVPFFILGVGAMLIWWPKAP
jgi:hypothetical protein